MKKYSLILLLLCIAVTSYGQDFKPFKVGIGLGYAVPASTGSGAGGGALFFIEPAYRAADNVSIGLRLETALIAGGSTVLAMTTSQAMLHQICLIR